MKQVLKKTLIISSALFLVIFILCQCLQSYSHSVYLIHCFRNHMLLGMLFLHIVFFTLKISNKKIFLSAAAIASLFLVHFNGKAFDSSNTKSITVLNLNMLYSYQGKALMQTIQNKKPDLIFLQEVSTINIKELEALNFAYPYSHIEEEYGVFGLAMFSKYPLNNYHLHKFPKRKLMQTAQLILPTHNIQLINVHLYGPVSKSHYKVRNQQWSHIAQYIQKIQTSKSVFLSGDFNTVPWSWAYKNFKKDSKAQECFRGLFFYGTYPAKLNLFGLPIDHCFYKNLSHVKVRKNITIKPADHRAQLIDIYY